jgi:creatinine amidohydrolase
VNQVSKEVRWQLLTREDVRAAALEQAVVVQPMGSIEQHGPHLPVDTDSASSEAIALKAARLAPFPVLIAPTVWWGVSDYWMRFGGTITVRHESLVDLLADIVAAVGRNGFRRVLLLNGHAGNSSVMYTVGMRFLTGDIKVVGLNYWMLVSDFLRDNCRSDQGMIGHAGEVETSLQLALRPEVVQAVLIPQVGTDLPRSVFGNRWREATITPPHPEAESPTGVYGRPAAARREFGLEILEAAAGQLVEFLDAFRRMPLDDEVGR